MPDDAALIAGYQRQVAELVALVAEQGATIAAQAETIEALRQANERLEARVAELERQAGQNSGNSGKPPSRDSAAERQRQAKERQERKAAAEGPKRKKGKQRGAKGSTLQMSPHPDTVVDHRPTRCQGCGAELDEDTSTGFAARQVVDLPEITPVVTEHRAHACRCSCGRTTTAAFPATVRSPVTYGPRVRAVVAYLLGRQHIPNRRVAEAMADLFGVPISTGAIDSIYNDASRRLGGFIAALVALLRSLPVLHADETSDRVGTKNCWMHVVSTCLYTLIHASVTRGSDAIDEAGVLRGYRGVVVHDRLAMYWKLKAKHGVCAAHLLRDLADVAVGVTQTAWAAGARRPARGDQRSVRRRTPSRPQAAGADAPAGLRRPLRRPGGRRRGRQPSAGVGSQTRLRRAPFVQPGHGLRHPPKSHPALHVRPRRQLDE